MSLSVGEMRGYCYLMSTPPPPSGFSTIFFKLHRCTEDVHLVWSIVVNLFFFSLFSTCELVPYANLGYNVYLFMIVTLPIFWKLRRCFVYGLKRAGGLGMILKIFSTRDLSLLAHAKYRVKKC